MNSFELKQYNKTFSDNKTDHYNDRKTKKVLYEIEKDELELSIALNMTIQEYRNRNYLYSKFFQKKID
jgi:hypothetical protein